MSLAGQASLLPVAVVVLLGGALVALVAGRWNARAPGVVAAFASACSGALLAGIAPAVYGGHLLVHHLGGWAPLHGTVLAVGWAADPFGLTYALIVCFACAAIGLAGSDETAGFAARESGQLWCLVLLLEAGLVGAALTADLFNLFVWFELASVASYGLTAFHLERPSALEAGFKIVVLTTMAGFLIFTGIGLLYGHFGALNFGQLHAAIAAQGHLGMAGNVGIALVVAGFATKAGLVPFHAWLPDAHSAAPGPVSALFSGVMVGMGVLAIARIAAVVVPAGISSLHGALMIIGLGSAIVGSALAFAQDDLKRLLAYDTIAQMGMVTIAIATGTAKGDAGATWHLLNHGVFKTLLFLVAGAIVHLTGTQKLSDMGGLGRRYPLLAGAFVVGALAIIGVPPLNGYASRLLIHGALVDQRDYVALAIVIVAEALSAAALIRAAWMAFFAAPPESWPITLGRLRPATVAVFAALAGACLAFGLAPARWLAGMAGPAAAVLHDPDRYAAAVTATTGHAVLFRSVVIPGSFVSSEVLLSTTAVVVVGALAARWRLRSDREVAPIRLLRSLHTGSVNDYAGYLVIGVVGLVVALLR